MKKILTLMAMLSLALGAQAEYYRYTFAIDIKGLPSDYSFSGDTGLYLVDIRDGGRVLSYTRSVSDKYENAGYEGWKISVPVEHTPGTVTVHGKDYSSDGHIIDAGAALKVDLNGVFQFTGNVFGLKDDDPNPLVGLEKGDLKLVVDSDSGAYFESMDFTWDKTAGGTYVVAGTIFVNVPEPTSGLLLLMGVAGLALRRKRVA